MKGELSPITFHWSHLLMLLPWILSFSTACRGIQLFMPWNCPGIDNVEEWGSQHHVEQTFYQRIWESVNIVLFSFSEQNLIKDRYMKSLLKNSNRKTYSEACLLWVVATADTHSFLYCTFLILSSLFSSLHILETLLLNQATPHKLCLRLCFLNVQGQEHLEYLHAWKNAPGWTLRNLLNTF